MTTAQAIEAIKDAGKFEILATRVLRLEEKSCRHIEHMGVNAEGKTIPNPLDAFCLVPLSEPPLFVMAVYNTFDLKKLEHKWLFDHAKAPRSQKATAADDGDLVKAARQAEPLRKNFPDAQFLVYLCTNKVVDPDMMAKVYQSANKLGLAAEIYGQSRIRDCLDMKPEGQWIRKDLLGIDAERLSLPLLRNLSHESLQLYAKEFPFTPPHRFISTEALRLLAESIQVGTRSVHVVIGGSGSGKSVVSYQMLQNHITAGGVGLRIPGEIAAKALSIEEAIEGALRSLHPGIQQRAGEIALSLATPQRRFLLIVDDVNRTAKPRSVIQKAVRWAKPMPGTEKSKEEGSKPNRFFLIIPTWGLNWASQEELFESGKWLGKIQVAQMNEDDSVSCLKAALLEQAETFSDWELAQFSETLGGDPILIAMFGDLIRTGGPQNASVGTRQVMERFIRSAINEAAAERRHLESEYRDALMALAEWMLDHRELHPRWNEIKSLLTTQRVQALRELAMLGKICEISAEERFHFRHDRILEYHLVTKVLHNRISEK